MRQPSSPEYLLLLAVVTATALIVLSPLLRVVASLGRVLCL